MGTKPRRSSDQRHCIWQAPVSRAAPEGTEGAGRETAAGDAARATPRDHPVPRSSLEPWLGLVAASWPTASSGEEPPAHPRDLSSIFPEFKSVFILTTGINRSGSLPSNPGPRISGAPDTAVGGDCSDPVYSLVSSSKNGMSTSIQLYPSLLIIFSLWRNLNIHFPFPLTRGCSALG